MAFYQELEPGDTIVVGNGTRITFIQKSGQRARMKIDSSEDIERVRAGDPVPPIRAASAPAAPQSGAAKATLKRPPITA